MIGMWGWSLPLDGTQTSTRNNEKTSSGGGAHQLPNLHQAPHVGTNTPKQTLLKSAKRKHPSDITKKSSLGFLRPKKKQRSFSHIVAFRPECRSIIPLSHFPLKVTPFFTRSARRRRYVYRPIQTLPNLSETRLTGASGKSHHVAPHISVPKSPS